MNAYNPDFAKSVKLAQFRKTLNKARKQYMTARRMIGMANKIADSAARSFAMKFFNKARRRLLDAMMQTHVILAS